MNLLDELFSIFDAPRRRYRRAKQGGRRKARKPTRAEMRALVKSGKAKPCACQKGHKH